MAESAASSMVDDDFTDGILDAYSTDETLLQISDEPEDMTNLFLFEEFMMPSKARRAVNTDFEPCDETDLLIETINGLDIGWKADTCKLSKGHAARGAHCEEAPLTLAQTKSEDLATQKTFGEGPEFPAAIEKAQKYMKKFASSEEIPDEELPENFTWEDIDGFDFTDAPRD